MIWENLRSDFILVGELELIPPNRLKFTSGPEALSVPSVYVVERTSQVGIATVLYVGMTSGGWVKRVKQHNGGLNRIFSGKSTSQRFVKNYDDRVQWLAQGDKIRVYEKEAVRSELHGQTVTLQHAEEAALIAILNPCHNWRPEK